MAKKRNKKRKNKKKSSLAQTADRHRLYENSVQCVEAEIDFVDATFEQIRGRKAVFLREDFCGTANTACEWVRRRPGNYAIGVDLDGDVLDWGRRHHIAELNDDQRPRIALVQDDVLKVDTPPQDVVLAMNFSYFMFKTRADLGGYFASVNNSLTPGGVFFMDCYGGYDAFRVMKEHTEYDDYTYTWDQADYNPITGDMTCHIHFKFRDKSRCKAAFSYDWRLWTLPEIRELLGEAGFAEVVCYWQGWDDDEDEGDGVFTAVEDAEPDAGWICYITAAK